MHVMKPDLDKVWTTLHVFSNTMNISCKHNKDDLKCIVYCCPGNISQPVADDLNNGYELPITYSHGVAIETM